MEENDGRAVKGHLPELVFENATDPVVQVISEADGDILYTARILGNRFRPAVYAPGAYTVKAGRDRPDTWSAKGLKASEDGGTAIKVSL